MFLPRFSGDDNPESWIFRAELYFTYLGFDANDWLPLPSFYLEGEALAWFNSLFCNKLFLDWTHFKVKFAQRFRQQANSEVSGRLANSSQVRFDGVNFIPKVSQSAMVSPLPAPTRVPKSPTSALADNTGSSQAHHVFDKLQVQYVALITENNTEVEPPEDVHTPQIENVNSVEANLVQEPSCITQDQVFGEMSRTTVSSNVHDLKVIVHEIEHSALLAVLRDTDGSNNEEEENSHDNVALFAKSPLRNTSGLLVSLACQGTVISTASARLAKIDYPFTDTLWLRLIPYWHYSLEEVCWGNRNEVSPCLDFRLCKCIWVDTGQECTLSVFLLSCIGVHWKCDSLAMSMRSVFVLGRITGLSKVSFKALLHTLPAVISDEVDTGALICKRNKLSFQGKKLIEALCLDNSFLENEISIATSETHYGEVYLEAENGKSVEGFNGQYNLHQFPFFPAANFLTVTIPVTAVDPHVWGPGTG
ncbi:hypothetical protein KY290_035143 [Solanum tuberosum]|uniref:Retrotransposon gag domain-containing protein n=1 Tax=Solanum tuberosum TaxID=4113 RepID=A0ABQ7U8T1_SOLTU|nr:hypothetical protein KY289_032631 [Solanum tuberosum]KAH0647271.1 hypothetical protein KY285_032519 [Solanum tuberosum]KAH0742100.1 hypothetical protein KY290_035143 [Solanum tuberosum]